MLFLQKAGGRFPVGATTFKLPVPRILFSRAKVAAGKSDGLKPALLLQEVVFTAYYPAALPHGNVSYGIDWLLRPLELSLLGYARFSGFSSWILWLIVHLYGRLLKIPVYRNAPLLNPYENTASSSPWPLVIFSHGLRGSRTAYSQLCTRIASSGRVVLAIEHRDGSGHACVPSHGDPILYIRKPDLSWPSGQQVDEHTMMSFHREQLAFRRREVYYTFGAMRDLVLEGRQKAGELQAVDGASIDWSSWSNGSQKKFIECDEDVVLVGHSFGGATVLSILTNNPPESECLIPVHRALILDPWFEALPLPDLHFIDKAPPRVFIINSEQFTLWKDHFQLLTDLVESWEQGQGQLVTIGK
ncbi:platelet-activating factor acetylhydrolase [Scleroderma citrinum]